MRYYLFLTITTTTLVYVLIKYASPMASNEIKAIDVPSVVQVSFDTEDIPAEDVKWFSYTDARANGFDKSFQIPSDQDNWYEVDFKADGKEGKMLYDGQGKLLAKSYKLSATDLPETIGEYITRNDYASWRKVRIEQEEQSTEARVKYKLWLASKLDKVMLVFDESGHLIKCVQWPRITEVYAARQQAAIHTLAHESKAIEPPGVICHVEEDNKGILEVEGWYLLEAVLDPAQLDFNSSYFDLQLPVFYQLNYCGIDDQSYTAFYDAFGIPQLSL